MKRRQKKNPVDPLKIAGFLILDILKDYSDENNHLTQQRIIELLKENCQIDCDRRTVSRYLDYIDAYHEKAGKEEIEQDGDGCYLAEREFDDSEIRTLIDSVLFSKALSQSQAKNLIEKLKTLGSKNLSAKVSHICNLQELHHSDSPQMMLSLDRINDAIDGRKKISFVYNEYGTDKKLHPRNNGMKYIVNPYQIVANNGFFYLIGNYDKYDNIAHYRVDRITGAEVLDEPVKPKKEIKDFKREYNLPNHMAEHIYMFSGPSAYIKIQTNKSMVGDLIDWFGKGITILDATDENITVRLKCNEEAMFYWALQYGPYVEVLEPPSLRERIKDAVCGMKEKYCR